MRFRSPASLTVAALAALSFAACDTTVTSTTNDAPLYKGNIGKADASAEAVFVDFEFEGEMITSHCFSARRNVQDQLLYTIGQLNGVNSVGRLDQLDITDLETATVDGKCKVTYHARMPVAWGQKDNVPDSYELLMPRDVTYAGLEKFTESYKDTCVDWGAHDVDSGSMWYYYRPARGNCRLDEADIVRLKADISTSPIGTTGKYPEYHKVWEDDSLRIVAVFGKYKDGATTGDAGINAYNEFARLITTELRDADLVTIPADIPNSPGVDMDDLTFSATLPDGKTVVVNALLVDNVRTAGADFDNRYEELTPRADLIVYNGHAGLGANVRALAQKGEWVTGQYAIVFMNGCDSYAYIDSALVDAHAEVNPDDPDGTLYLDTMANALPSFFRSMAGATMALVRGLMSFDAPKTYEQIFGGIDAAEVVLVTGEHDNVYVPGYPDSVDGPTDSAWDGMTENDELARGEERRYETPILPEGRYRFTLAGSGDADLYVRVGDAPSTQLFDCRPYLSSSDETCDVTISARGPIHLMVTGYGDRSVFRLDGEVLQ